MNENNPPLLKVFPTLKLARKASRAMIKRIVNKRQYERDIDDVFEPTPLKARLRLDTSAFDSALAELKLLFPKIPKKLRLRFLKTPSKLCCFNGGVTKGTTHTAFLKPSNLLLNLLAAARTGDFKRFVVE